jgi:tyrosinase
MATRVRKDVWKLSKIKPWHDDILWYAKAIVEMQKRPARDSTSWIYQAAIHETSQSPNPHPTFWTQCQHFSWFFLPWHRIYLFLFEQIIADWIASQPGGPKDWSLFYWNYSDSSNADATKLPPAFIDPVLPLPGSPPNPLRVTNRARGNDGNSVTSRSNQVSLGCLREPDFFHTSLGATSFGGPETGFNHDNGSAGMGHLDSTPHGAIHNAIGGGMGAFDTAGLDPIFWVHHSNIDRLWNVWLKRDAGHQNPTDPRWLNLKFKFHNASKKIVKMSSSEVVDSTTSPLNYEYQDESDPIAGRAGITPPRRPAMATKSTPEMVGSTHPNPVTLRGKAESAKLAVKAPTGPGRLTLPAGAPPPLVLNLENVRGPQHSTGYGVYVNLPPDSKPDNHPELFAGNMSLFGLKEASRAKGEHAGSGLHYSYDISGIVQKLQEKGDWDPENVRVTFVPDYELEGRASAGEGVQVGRISVYHK